MKNEDSRGLRRLYLGRKSVPNVQDNLTTNKTPLHGKITGKQKSNALKRLTHGKSAWRMKSKRLMQKVHGLGCLTPRSSRHMLKTHRPRLQAHGSLQKKVVFLWIFCPWKPVFLAQVRWKLSLSQQGLYLILPLKINRNPDNHTYIQLRD